MASSPRHTNTFNFGEEGITHINDRTKEQHHEGNRDNDDKPLLYTNLRHNQSTPSSVAPSTNPLSFQYSHSYSYSHSRSHSRSYSNSIPDYIDQPPLNDEDTDNDIDVNQQRQRLKPMVHHAHSHSYPTPRDSTDSLSSPITEAKLKSWLEEHGLEAIYDKLKNAGIGDVDLLAEADNDDIKQITTDLDLICPQRLKLRKAIRSLKEKRNISRNASLSDANSIPFSNINLGSGSGLNMMDNDHTRLSKYRNKMKLNGRSNSVCITEKEKECMMNLSSFEKKLNEYMDIIKRKEIELEEEKKSKEQLITDEFESLFRTLYQRKEDLINQLHFIYSQKKDKFEQSLAKLKSSKEETKKTQKQCSELLLKQTGRDLEHNIYQIDHIETKIMSITDRCLQPISPININTKIKVDIKNKDIIQILSVMGVINPDDSRLDVIAYDPQYRDRYNFNDSDNDQENDELKMAETDYSHSISRQAQLRRQKSLERQRTFHQQNRSRTFVQKRSNSRSDISFHGHSRSQSDLFRTRSPSRHHHRARSSQCYSRSNARHQHHDHGNNNPFSQLSPPRRFQASLSLPEIRRNKSDMDLCPRDEWLACGDNLKISSDDEKFITNIAK